MVADFFEMDGWDTYYIGAGVPVDQILAAIEQHKPDLVALSATMTHHVSKVQEIITRIRAAFPDATPPIMVGGLPFNMSPELWCRVGADIWAGDAGRAVEAARQMFITS
jgi:methanogenic corrinoid protein MtbC1